MGELLVSRLGYIVSLYLKCVALAVNLFGRDCLGVSHFFNVGRFEVAAGCFYVVLFKAQKAGFSIM